MTQYERGANFERRVKRWLEGQGYFCVRSAGSKGPVDLVAVGPYETVLVQCKKGGRMSPEERNELLRLKHGYCVRVAMAVPGPVLRYLWGE
jgi:Holliday junction resolvase